MQSPAHRSHYLKTLRATSEYRWFRLAVTVFFYTQCAAGCLFAVGGIAVAIMVMIEAPYASPIGLGLQLSTQDAAVAGLVTLLYAVLVGAAIIACAVVLWTPLQMLADALDMRIDAAATSPVRAESASMPTPPPAPASVAPSPSSPAATTAAATTAVAAPTPARRQPTREEQATLLLAQARASFGRGEHANAARLLASLRERFPDTKAAASTLE